MPVYVDLAQFPRLMCRRCGLVALVDPALASDVRATLLCPNCSRPLLPPNPPARRGADQRPGEPAATAVNPATSLPSHAAVGLSIAALFMLVLIGLFVVLALTPHQSYWGALTH